MDFICSLTGKSPSTTGAGSEGAMTKGPFNALFTTADLNAALCGFILTGLAGFSTAAGYVGPKRRVDHDISLLVPELWCRLSAQERDPGRPDRQRLPGETRRLHARRRRMIPASRLGYRITYEFVRTFFGRIFDNPDPGARRGHAPARDAGHGRLRRRHPQHHRGAAARGAAVLRGWQHRAGLPAAAGAALDHGARPVRGERCAPPRHPPPVHPRAPARPATGICQRLRQRPAARHPTLAALSGLSRRLLPPRPTTTSPGQLDIPSRLAHAQGELQRASAPAYCDALRGTIGADAI